MKQSFQEILILDFMHKMPHSRLHFIKNYALRLVLLPVFFGGFHFFQGQDLRKKTVPYATKSGERLLLDKYDDGSKTRLKPCLIFVNGGAFRYGKREDPFFTPYFEFLVKKGFVVLSIDYRQGMNNPNFSDIQSFVTQLEQSINMAADDLFDATNFALKNATEWNIDPKKILCSGGSAGAISILQAQYLVSTESTLARKLPRDFKYAGVIAFSGAIFSKNGALQWKNLPPPMFLSHGNADQAVPYEKLEMMNFGLYGSKTIAAELKKRNIPYYFITYNNLGHESVGKKMEGFNEIESFIDHIVFEQKKINAEATINFIGRPEAKKDFNISDYSNFLFGGGK